MVENQLSENILKCAKKVKLLLMDCDGVLTDGKLYFSKDGEALKVFHVRDGQGLVIWHSAGFLSGVITGRKSKMLEKRGSELGIKYLKQSSEDKLKDFEKIILDAKVSSDEVAYLGDDVSDINLLNSVGFPVAVNDSVEKVRSCARYVTLKRGGDGAVREVVDLLMKSKISG